MPFNGITNLRDRDETIEVEPWQLKELARCARDPIYFIEHYVYINTKDNGMQLFTMYEFQKEAVRRYTKFRFNIQKWPRQCGKSTTARGFILWYAMFNADKIVAILGNKLSLAQEQLQQLRESYIMLPMWMQPGVKQWNKRAVQFSHGTRIICAATSTDGIRGMAINFLYIDEFAFIKPHIADEFIASVFPTISSGKTTQVVITSTPNGMNQFYRMWENGCEIENAIDVNSDNDETNGYIKSEIAWNAVPGRDLKWAQEQINQLGEIRFNQEYKCEFIGSVSTLIDHHFLKTLNPSKPLKIPNLPDYIKIYSLPIKREKIDAENWEYVASLDSGYGVYQDNTVLQIFLVKSNICLHQVAVIASNSMDIDAFCRKAAVILNKYHNPNLIIEQNGPGIAAMKFFYATVGYDNLLHFDPSGRHMGLWASEKTKQNACILFKTYIQRKFMHIYDRETMNEMAAFGKVSQERWGAMGGNHDDHITSAYWIPFYLQSPLYYGTIVDVNLKSLDEDNIILKTQEQIDNEQRIFSETGNREMINEALNNAKFKPLHGEKYQNDETVNENNDEDDDDDNSCGGIIMFKT